MDADASSCSVGSVRLRGCQGAGGGNLSAVRNSLRPMVSTLSSIKVWINIRTTPCLRTFPVNNSKSFGLRHVVAILSSSSFTSISEDDEVFAEERLLLPIVEVNVEVEVALTKRVSISSENFEFVLVLILTKL